MAKFPWIDEELNQRKEDCCERLFLDALKRMGIPPPTNRINLLDEELFPSIYDKLYNPTVPPSPVVSYHRKNASRDSRTSKGLSIKKIESQPRPFVSQADIELERDLISYKDLRVPKDPFKDADDEFCDLENLPVLMINVS